jgi:hypothetical protein
MSLGNCFCHDYSLVFLFSWVTERAHGDGYLDHAGRHVASHAGTGVCHWALLTGRRLTTSTVVGLLPYDSRW